MIFPDWGENPEAASEEVALPLFREWAVDWENQCFALRCGETITGLISAAALMRPTGYEGMEVKSIKKKMKDKAFAASVCRDNIRQCEQAGLPLDAFLALSIAAMRDCFSQPA